MTLPRTYSTEEVAAAFGVSEKTLLGYIARGMVTPMRKGVNLRKHWRTGKTVNASPYIFTDEDVEQLKAALRPPPKPTTSRGRRRVA